VFGSVHLLDSQTFLEANEKKKSHIHLKRRQKEGFAQGKTDESLCVASVGESVSHAAEFKRHETM